MKGVKQIRTRIKAVKGTCKITRAMQLVASSKMKKSQNLAINGRAYEVLLADILSSVLKSLKDSSYGQINHPFFNQRPIKNRGILIFSTDKGLCGALNSNLFRKVSEIENGVYFAVGSKAVQYLTRRKQNLKMSFNLNDFVSYSEIRPIVKAMLDAWQNGEIDTIEVLYPSFVNTLKQESTLMKLLPISSFGKILEDSKKKLGVALAKEDSREMIFEPSIEQILEDLPKYFLSTTIYQMSLEAKASEQSARMVAMKNATDNAKNLINELSLEYNKLRQDAITNEILELAAAASK